MDFFKLFATPIITVLFLYLLNRFFNYKSYLIKLSKSIFIYKCILLVSTLIFLTVYTYRFGKNISSEPLGVSVFYSYLYLVFIPKELR